MATNLVHNAIVHNLPDQGTVWVTTNARSESVTLTVENTGEKLTPQLVTTLAEPFQRGSRTPSHRRWGRRPRPGHRQEHRPSTRRHPCPRRPSRWRSVRDGRNYPPRREWPRTVNNTRAARRVSSHSGPTSWWYITSRLTGSWRIRVVPTRTPATASTTGTAAARSDEAHGRRGRPVWLSGDHAFLLGRHSHEDMLAVGKRMGGPHREGPPCGGPLQRARGCLSSGHVSQVIGP